MRFALVLDCDAKAVKLDTSEDKIIGTVFENENSKSTYYRHELSKDRDTLNGFYYHILNENGVISFHEDIEAGYVITEMSCGGCFSDDEELLDIVVSEANRRTDHCYTKDEKGENN